MPTAETGVEVGVGRHPREWAGLSAAGPATPRVLGPFFLLAESANAAARAIRPIAVPAVARLSRGVRRATRANARGIFGRELSPGEQRRFTRGVVASFYDFVTALARASRLSREAMAGLVDSFEGHDLYLRAREPRRGAVLVTAHIGSFEIGLAALARIERRISVVFKRDGVRPFERVRARLRDRLGVVEAPIDHGWETWLRLREALINNEVVVMQGDRAIQGQRATVVDFLHGRLRLPTGPARLSRLTGSPIVPVFTLPGAGGRCRIVVKPAIEPAAFAGGGADERMTAHVASVIASVVAEQPERWLALAPMFEKEARPAPRSGLAGGARDGE